MRISCSSEPEDPEDIDPNLITAVELVSLPSKRVIMDFLQDEGGLRRVVWSQDSKWLAFPLSEGHRITYTRVYHRSGDDFNQLETEDEVRVDAKGDVRNEYVRPIRWIKPGVLLLE